MSSYLLTDIVFAPLTCGSSIVCSAVLLPSDLHFLLTFWHSTDSDTFSGWKGHLSFSMKSAFTPSQAFKVLCLSRRRGLYMTVEKLLICTYVCKCVCQLWGLLSWAGLQWKCLVTLANNSLVSKHVEIRLRALRTSIVESGLKCRTPRGYCRRHLYFPFFNVANTSIQPSTQSSTGHHAIDQRSGTAGDLLLSPGWLPDRWPVCLIRLVLTRRPLLEELGILPGINSRQNWSQQNMRKRSWGVGWA